MGDRTFERIPEAHPQGGYLVSDQQAVEEQRAVVWDLAKQLGQAITNGGNITRIAVPVHIAEPRSYTERIADGWCFAPVFLTKAARCNDPVERMKNVVAFALAGLHNTLFPKKPFNPILGETYQATFSDGTQLFTEQASHHPPVTNWEMLGPGGEWHFYGSGEWVASLRGNSVKGHQLGNHYVAFPDGCTIVYNLAEVWGKGIMFGERICDYCGTMEWRDEKNDLFAQVKFNPEVSTWFGFSKKKLLSDYILGGIYEGDQPDEKKKLSLIDGTWLGSVEFDGLPYWSFELPIEKFVPVPLPEPLPSDCRYREDIIYLKAQDIPAAGEWKFKLEEKQRGDARLRKEWAKANGRDKKKESKKKKDKKAE